LWEDKEEDKLEDKLGIAVNCEALGKTEHTLDKTRELAAAKTHLNNNGKWMQQANRHS
jgi:hypothetical protein